MRDPAGRITLDGDSVFRHLNQPAGPEHFLKSSTAARWVASGDLIAYEWLDPRTLRSPRLPFVSLPSEWTAWQFHVAAKLTLRLMGEAADGGWDMKDASAWNIVFDGLRPVFVDLLSFEPLQGKLWRAAGQFSRQFLLPLLLATRQQMEPHHCLQIWRDGVPSDFVRNQLGPSRFLTRYWPLMADGKVSRKDKTSQRSTPESVDRAGDPIKRSSISEAQRFRRHLHSSLSWMLEGVDPTNQKARTTVWGQYERERVHYSETALSFKRQTVSRWLQELRPRWVLDIGCNAGEFSELAVACGARAICWDADPQALNTLCLRHGDSIEATHYHPLLCPVDDVPGGRGWMGQEFLPLMQRLHQRVDVMLLLAVTHHLAIAGGVRLEDIFRFAATVSRRAVLLELLSDDDERVQQLCRHYGRDAAEFSLQKQYEAAEAAGLYLVQRVRRSYDDTREYAWLEPIPEQVRH